ncbi:hypothetical protein BGZ52_008517, partial [Haplosporangium bisporale]
CRMVTGLLVNETHHTHGGLSRDLDLDLHPLLDANLRLRGMPLEHLAQCKCLASKILHVHQPKAQHQLKE